MDSVGALVDISGQRCAILGKASLREVSRSIGVWVAAKAITLLRCHFWEGLHALGSGQRRRGRRVGRADCYIRVVFTWLTHCSLPACSSCPRPSRRSLLGCSPGSNYSNRTRCLHSRSQESEWSLSTTTTTPASRTRLMRGPPLVLPRQQPVRVSCMSRTSVRGLGMRGLGGGRLCGG